MSLHLRQNKSPLKGSNHCLACCAFTVGALWTITFRSVVIDWLNGATNRKRFPVTCRTFHCMSHPYAAHEKNQTNKKKLLGSLILLKGQDCTDFHNFPDEFCIASFQLASKKKQKKPTGIAPVSKNSGASFPKRAFSICWGLLSSDISARDGSFTTERAYPERQATAPSDPVTSTNATINSGWKHETIQGL